MTLREWLANGLTPSNIIAMLCAAAVFLVGTERFQNKTAEIAANNTRRIETLEKRMGEQDGKMVGRRTYMGCSVRRIDSIQTDVDQILKLPNRKHACELEIAE